MEERWLGPEKRRKILLQAGGSPHHIGQFEDMVAETLVARHESNFYLGQEGHWLFDCDTVAAAADAAADLGFEATEIVEFHAEDGWHRKPKIVRDIKQALGGKEGAKPAKSKAKSVENGADGDAVWERIEDMLRLHVKEDILIYVVCPSMEPETTVAGSSHKRSFDSQADKVRRNVARLVDCVAQTWHKEAEAGTEIGNAAVLLQGWGDDVLSVHWNPQEVSNYHVEMVGW